MAYIIGLTGLAGAGKDSFAGALLVALQSRKVPCEVTSWAKPIRAITQSLGFRPFDRDLKEQEASLLTCYFYDDLMDSIKEHLGGYLSQRESAELYSLTAEAMRPFISQGVLRISPRKFMQLFGTECGRRLFDECWVGYLLNEYDAFDGVVLVPDTRFRNEVEVVDEVLNVIRPGIEAMDHASEQLAAYLLTASPPLLGGADVRNVLNGHSLWHLGDRAAEHADRIAEVLRRK